MFRLVKYNKERRVSTRVRGLELQLLEKSKLSNKDLVRYALKKFFEERPISAETQILAEIGFLQDKNYEYGLMIEANELLLKEKMLELEEIRANRSMVRYTRLVDEIYTAYLEFIDDDSYTDDFRLDISNFYSVRRGAIDIAAMKAGKSFEEAIECFEFYMDSICDDEYLEDMESVEDNISEEINIDSMVNADNEKSIVNGN